jgi:hypothetical protein
MNKVGTSIGNYAIIPKEGIKNFDHDGILIATYNRKGEIKEKLLKINYPNSNIIEFFD